MLDLNIHNTRVQTPDQKRIQYDLVSVAKHTVNQDVHDGTQTSRNIFPISLVNLYNLETRALHL